MSYNPPTIDADLHGLLRDEKLALCSELSRVFSALLDLEELIPCILSRMKNLISAESCAILLLDEERNELFFPVIIDVSAEMESRLRNVRIPAGQGISGWVVKHGEPVLVPDVRKDERFNPFVDRSTGLKTRDLLCVPLRTRHGVIGVVGARNKCNGTFTKDDLTFLNGLAGPITIAIDNALAYKHVRESEARLRSELERMRGELASRSGYPGIIGTSASMTKVFDLVETAARSPLTVLLEGETGTGKELIAQTIHQHSARKDKPFVAVNCGALPEALMESELFGHKKGAFTGATTDKKGLFEEAQGGTIFLDEIGEASESVQRGLLRVLQEGEIRRVGETRPRRIDVRVISATNRDLEQEVRNQRFRLDLFYRLNVFPIRVPPLRERREDIPLLVNHFVQQSSIKLGKNVEEISKRALMLLTDYAWPGNVRELQNEVERAIAIVPPGNPIARRHLSEKITAQHSLRVDLPREATRLKEARQTFERNYINRILDQNSGNVTKSAKALGISRQMLQTKIREYGLRR